MDRPHITVILAMSADGKIADRMRSPARFGSAADKIHLESQIAQADAALFGCGTLRAYGTTLRISSPRLLEQRQQQGKPPQPIQIVCSQSGIIDPHWRFFQQPVPRWLITTQPQEENRVHQESQTKCFEPIFDQIVVAANAEGEIHWQNALQQLVNLGIKRLAVLGGGQLVGSLMDAKFVDEFWLTICPLILGGTHAPTPVEGHGFLATVAPHLELLEVKQIEQEVFLHYRLHPL